MAWKLKINKKRKILRKCPYCDNYFKVAASRINHGRGKYCSVNCKNKHTSITKNIKQEKICLNCHSKFYLYPSKLSNTKGSGKYCSRSCRDIHWHGENTPCWQGVGRKIDYGNNWQSSRRAALQRDKVCQTCKTSKNLQVHHKIPIRLFSCKEEANNLDNLITLCAKHHRMVESEYKWFALPIGAGILQFNAGGHAWEKHREFMKGNVLC